MERFDFKSLNISLPEKFNGINIDSYRIDTDGLPIFRILHPEETLKEKGMKLVEECSDYLTNIMLERGIVKREGATDLKSVGIEVPEKYKSLHIYSYETNEEGWPTFHALKNVDEELYDECCRYLIGKMLSKGIIKPAKPKGFNFKRLGIKLPKKFQKFQIPTYIIESDGMPNFYISNFYDFNQKQIDECYDYLTGEMIRKGIIRPVYKPSVFEEFNLSQFFGL